MIIDPTSVQAGDIIFLFTQAKRAQINISGQSFMRLGSILVGDYRRSRYSHVMLGISQGVVIHSNGKSVKMERLTDAIGGSQIDKDKLLVMRLAHPPLEGSDAMRIVSEAQVFLKQTYSFIPGRKSTYFGRMLHRKRRLTHPFCSELVAATYAAIGRPITKRPPDRVLPLDLEMHCTPPTWCDVTEQYVVQTVPDAIDGMSIDIAGRLLTLPEFFQETDQLLHKMWGHHVEQANLAYNIAESTIAPCALLQQLRSTELAMSKNLTLNPLLLFTSYLSITRADLTSLRAFYHDIRTGIFDNLTPFSDGLCQMLPQVPSDKRAYESIPSVDELREFELLGASLAFGARALRLETELSGIAVALGIPLKSKERFDGVTKEMVAPLLDKIFELPQTEIDELLLSIQSITMPRSKSYTADVRRLCSNTARLHAALSILCHGAQAK
jgi:hypothetical protein